MAQNDHTTLTNEAGIGLVEALIGLLVLTIVLLAAAQLFRVQVTHLALTERARRADTEANKLMSSLAAYNRSSLPDVQPLAGRTSTDAIPDGAQLSLDTNVCQAAFGCDKVVRIQQASGTGVDYVTVPWNQTNPTGSTMAYYRAWRVTTIDAARQLRQITVAILPADLDNQPSAAIEPLALRQSTVVQRQ